MTPAIAAGKRKGLQAVADARGVIAALAIDQRGAMKSLFAKVMGVAPDHVPAEVLVSFKDAVSRILPPHTSAILLNREHRRPAARQTAKSAGLLLANEQTGCDYEVHGTMPRFLEGWTKLAAESGVNFSGVLCGRATWKDGVAVFAKRGQAALGDWLHEEGVGNTENVNQGLRAAQPWYLMSEEASTERR